MGTDNSKTVFDYVVSQQYMRLFLSLRERGRTVIDCASEIDMTYSHLSKVCRKLEDEGFLHSEMKGRQKTLTLTPAGLSVAEGMSLIRHGAYMADNNVASTKN